MKSKFRESDAAPDSAALLAQVKGAAKSESSRLELATDLEFWFCVYFDTRAQKEHFLQRLGWDDLGLKYIDGCALADDLQIELPARLDVMRTSGAKIDRKYAALAEDIDHESR